MGSHRVTCQDMACMGNGLLRVWRENCAECAAETADKHRRETGHAVELTIVADTPTMAELRDMTRRARMVLLSTKRGGWL